MTLDQVRAELAPKGVLRAGINLSNFLLVTGRTAAGEPEGVSPSLAAEIARRLDVAIEYVVFKNPGELADAATEDLWDIGLIGAEPARAEHIRFTVAYAEIEATFMVPSGSTIKRIDEVELLKDMPDSGTLLSSSNTAAEDTELLKETFNEKYKWGFVTDIEADSAPPGLDESTIAFISAKKEEPEWLLEWRLKAYRHWLTMEEPEWAHLNYEKPNYDEIIFYSAPKSLEDAPKSLDEVDPKLLETYEKLGIPLHERAALAGVAVDAVFDSVSVGTTFQDKLAELGIIFCPISEAVHKHPELVKKYLGTIVPYSDNYYATLNSAVFTDGSFVYVPKGVKCPMDLSTYFRINAKSTGQFERTLIIAEEGASVSYLEGCTAPMRDENQLHAAVVELVALGDAEIKYSTVQNWYPGDEDGKGGIYNFVTKRGICKGDRSKICWTQVETGSAITWKYPSVILRGDDSVGEFYSVALANLAQQADTGTKMIHLGKNTRSTIISKGISAGKGQNSYRGLV